MLSFGHAVYMGVGGFLCMHLMNMIENDGFADPAAGACRFSAGCSAWPRAVIVGSFSTRRAGTVFAMISLGIGELIAACSIIIVAFFGGEEGISGDRTYGAGDLRRRLSPSRSRSTTSPPLDAPVGGLADVPLSRTPIGRMANAVRDNPERAEFLGYSQRWVRYYSFVASGFFAGVAGGLFAINYEILTEENLNLVTSGTILLVTFLGGVGFFFGPIIGAVVFTLLQTVLSLADRALAALSRYSLFVLTVMFFPRGLTGLIWRCMRPAAEVRAGLIWSRLYKDPDARAPSPSLCLAGLIEMAAPRQLGRRRARRTCSGSTFQPRCACRLAVLSGSSRAARTGSWLASGAAPERGLGRGQCAARGSA